MCLLLETIKLNDGVLENVFYHNWRMNASRTELFNVRSKIRLEKEISIPDEFKSGLYRCRILYRNTIEKIEFVPLSPRSFFKLKVIVHAQFDYHLKFADRALLHYLFSQRDDADEIIIIQDGLVTDCTIGNLVFFDGKEWLTPDRPLLKGTQRQALLERKLLLEKRITEKDLFTFKKVGIINAFFDLHHMPEIKIENIFR